MRQRAGFGARVGMHRSVCQTCQGTGPRAGRPRVGRSGVAATGGRLARLADRRGQRVAPGERVRFERRTPFVEAVEQVKCQPTE